MIMANGIKADTMLDNASIKVYEGSNGHNTDGHVNVMVPGHLIEVLGDNVMVPGNDIKVKVLAVIVPGMIMIVLGDNVMVPGSSIIVLGK